MNVDHYTPFVSNRKNLGSFFYATKNIETVMLTVLAIVGIVGSVFLIANKPNYTSPNGAPEYAAVSGLLSGWDEENRASDFDKFVKMNSKSKVGETMVISFLADEKASRYVMDMGNGERLIVTQKNLIYTYDKPGKYTIELKEINKGLLHLKGTKVIKVK